MIGALGVRRCQEMNSLCDLEAFTFSSNKSARWEKMGSVGVVLARVAWLILLSEKGLHISLITFISMSPSVQVTGGKALLIGSVSHVLLVYQYSVLRTDQQSAASSPKQYTNLLGAARNFCVLLSKRKE